MKIKKEEKKINESKIKKEAKMEQLKRKKAREKARYVLIYLSYLLQMYGVLN